MYAVPGSGIFRLLRGDGTALKGRHARTYRVRAADAGHELACQTHRPDGGVARSRALTVTP